MSNKETFFTGSTSTEVTARELTHRRISKNAAAECIVLLRNRDHLLPIAPGSKLALYGAGAGRTIKGGTGSGDVNCRDVVSVWLGLENAGYELTTTAWLSSFDKIYEASRYAWRDEIFRKMREDYAGRADSFFDAYSSTQYQMPAGDPINEEAALADGADTAIYVLSRVAGENADRYTKEGDFYLTKEERSLLDQISRCYKHVVLILNSGGLVDLGFTDEIPNLDGILHLSQPGMEGGNALAEVISGRVSPSGKLADTWPLCYEDYPNAATFSHMKDNVLKEFYTEGIYVGYRYFDSFRIPVRYCFGYGLSYTDFQIKTEEIQVNPVFASVTVTAAVKNTGTQYSGKEVLQLYVSCPQGRLPKEYRRLAAYNKTNVLAPGEEASVKLRFNLEDLTSYDQKSASWILEKGCYGIWLGDSLESAELVGTMTLEEEGVVKKCEHICQIQEEFEEIKPPVIDTSWLEAAKNVPNVVFPSGMILTKTVDYSNPTKEFTGKAGEIVEKLSLDQLIAFTAGDPGKSHMTSDALGSAGNSVPGSAAETTDCAFEEYGVKSIALADGPAGLRLSKSYQVVDGHIIKESFQNAMEEGFFAIPSEKKGTTYYQYLTSIPVGAALAQSWNKVLLADIGKMIGAEMELFHVQSWLAPGMNIHRNALCGRNFEYYSEDPFLSGSTAAAITRGVQSIPGCGTTIKHFACNNQEDNRYNNDSIVHERALREIYLKNFEIAVRDSQPLFLMTSYNMVNGIHTPNSYDLCTKILRNEWGFEGAIMTDWTTTTETKVGISTASGCMRAGNDMIMPGDPADFADIRKALEDGSLSVQEIKQCVYRTLQVVLKTTDI